MCAQHVDIHTICTRIYYDVVPGARIPDLVTHRACQYQGFYTTQSIRRQAEANTSRARANSFTHLITFERKFKHVANQSASGGVVVVVYSLKARQHTHFNHKYTMRHACARACAWCDNLNPTNVARKWSNLDARSR